jgi:hypothetical protein
MRFIYRNMNVKKHIQGAKSFVEMNCASQRILYVIISPLCECGTCSVAVLSITAWNDKTKQNKNNYCMLCNRLKKWLVPTLCRYVDRSWPKSTTVPDTAGPQLSVTVTSLLINQSLSQVF